MKNFSLPSFNNSGLSSAVMTCPLRKRAFLDDAANDLRHVMAEDLSDRVGMRQFVVSKITPLNLSNSVR